jgi:hypothetical protein
MIKAARDKERSRLDTEVERKNYNMFTRDTLPEYLKDNIINYMFGTGSKILPDKVFKAHRTKQTQAEQVLGRRLSDDENANILRENNFRKNTAPESYKTEEENEILNGTITTEWISKHPEEWKAIMLKWAPMRTLNEADIKKKGKLPPLKIDKVKPSRSEAFARMLKTREALDNIPEEEELPVPSKKRKMGKEEVEDEAPQPKRKATGMKQLPKSKKDLDALKKAVVQDDDDHEDSDAGEDVENDPEEEVENDENDSDNEDN